MTTCPSCTAELELDATYCGQCGSRVRARRTTLVGAELDGQFFVDAKIAEGGFGTIYRATHLASRNLVALKVLHAELAADEMLAARFRREGETLRSLSSPHTVSVYDLGETYDGTLYIAMELLYGESLLDRFRARGALPWRGVLEIMKQVCRSLGEAHSLGIVHRDLKPANIHLGAHDYVKVLDFGIAKLIRPSATDQHSDLTRVGQAVGTLEYMAPEQLIGSECDGRSDIYALGVMFYEMLTGRRPYADATGPTSLVAAVMTEPIIPPSSLFECGCIPPEVDRLVVRCLAKEPKDRYSNVFDVIDAIDAILAPLARGSWSTEMSEPDAESTWIDTVPQSALPQIIITPSRQPVMHAEGIGYEATHVQTVSPTTNPGLGPLTPTSMRTPVAPSRAPTDIGAITPRGLARGSSSPVSPYQRARRQSDLELQTFTAAPAPFAEGSRVRVRLAPGDQAHLAPAPAPTGSVPLVIARTTAPLAPTLPAPTMIRLETRAPSIDEAKAVRSLGALRILLWTIGLLVGGAAAGMILTSLIG